VISATENVIFISCLRHALRLSTRGRAFLTVRLVRLELGDAGEILSALRAGETDYSSSKAIATVNLIAIL
jgi:hypothetical protein